MSSTKSILITGSGGFIGSHIMKHFLKKKANVYGVDCNSPRMTNGGGKRFFTADISHKKSIEQILGRLRPACIIHHASNLVDIEASVQNPLQAIKDLTTTVQLIETARVYGLQHVIFASSANVYGDRNVTAVAESAPPLPLSPYGLTKLAIEQYLSYFGNRYGIPCTVLRYFNVYGPRQSLKNHPVIPSFIYSLLHGAPITIFGGDQVRDFIYVKDVANANWYAYKKAKGGTYNVGSGKKTSITEILRLLRQNISSDAVITYKNQSPSDCMFSLAKIAKITAELGWTPSTSLASGLKHTTEYYTNEAAQEVISR